MNENSSNMVINNITEHKTSTTKRLQRVHHKGPELYRISLGLGETGIITNVFIKSDNKHLGSIWENRGGNYFTSFETAGGMTLDEEDRVDGSVEGGGVLWDAAAPDHREWLQRYRG